MCRRSHFALRRHKILHRACENVETKGEGFLLRRDASRSDSQDKFVIECEDSGKCEGKIFFAHGTRAIEISFSSFQKKILPMKYLVFHWTPSEIIDTTKYRPVTMPSCDLYKNETNNCRYDLIPVSVYFNDRVKESDELMDVMRRLHFSSLQPLLDLYGREAFEIQKLYINKIVHEDSTESLEGFYNKIACKWLQENQEVYSIGDKNSWIKKSTDLKEISIGGM